MRIAIRHLPRWSWATLVALVAFAQACETVSVATIDVTSVVVDPAAATILVNEFGTLAATARASSGNVLRGRLVSWTSLDPDVATVDAEGVVRALAAGTATIQAIVEGVSGTASITVELPAALELSESVVEFAAPFEGGPTPTHALTVRSSDGSAVSGLSASVAAGGPAPWLEFALLSGVTPATLEVRAVPAGLAGGTYQATIAVASTTTGILSTALEVTLQVGEAPPELVVTPSSLSLAADQGRAPPPPRLIDVTSRGGGTVSGLRFSVDYAPGSGSGWLVVSLNRTSAPAVLSVGVDPEGLSPGVYDAEVGLEASSAPGASARVGVRFRYGEPPPEIELDAEQLSWEILEGALAIATQTVGVTNRGSGLLSPLTASVTYETSGPTGWLSAGVAPASAPGTLHVSVMDPGFQPGEYRATVDVLSPSAINSPQSVAVLVRVRPRPSPERSTVAAIPTSVPADGASTSLVTVRLLDARGDPVTSGMHVVTMSATAGTLGPVQTAGGEVYTALLTSPMAPASATVTVSVDGRPLTQSATVAFVPGPPSAATSTLVGAPASIVANGVSTSTITLQLRDANGSATTAPPDAAVAFATTAGTLGPVTDQGGGRYTAVLGPSVVVGVASVTATLNGASIGGAASVSFVAGPAAGIRLTGPTEGTPLVPSAPFTLTLVDAFGNPATSASPETFALSNDGVLGFFSPSSPITIPPGVPSTTFTFTTLLGGSRTVTVTWVGGGPTPLGSTSHSIRY